MCYTYIHNNIRLTRSTYRPVNIGYNHSAVNHYKYFIDPFRLGLVRKAQNVRMLVRIEIERKVTYCRTPVPTKIYWLVMFPKCQYHSLITICTTFIYFGTLKFIRKYVQRDSSTFLLNFMFSSKLYYYAMQNTKQLN